MTEFRKRFDRIIAILHQLPGWFWIQLKSDAAAICDAKAAAIFTPQDPAKRGHLLIICEPNGDSAAGWALSTSGDGQFIATGGTLCELLSKPEAMAALELDPATS